MSQSVFEASRRRTFAIISHPDAGKTTLTEKFLLYAGAVGEAGAVKAREGRRSATSDWMEMEKKRGISISSTALTFDYRGMQFNLLDTPGHRDFSEDTYRVLAAVDSVVMVLDVAKGIEPQTLKLFEVCRSRNLPVITFLNKYDRPGRAPLELLDEIEEQIGLRPTPATWPVGIPGDFRGVIDRTSGEFTRFTRTVRGSAIAPEEVISTDQAAVEEGVLGPKQLTTLNCLMPLEQLSTASHFSLRSRHRYSSVLRSQILVSVTCLTPWLILPRRQGSGSMFTSRRGRSTVAVLHLFLRFRPTWTNRIEIALRLFGCALGNLSVEWCSPAIAQESHLRQSTHLRCLVQSEAQLMRRFPVMSSVS